MATTIQQIHPVAHLPLVLVHFLKTSCASAFVPGNAGHQPGPRSHAGAWRSQENAQALLWRCTRSSGVHPGGACISLRAWHAPDTRVVIYE